MEEWGRGGGRALVEERGEKIVEGVGGKEIVRERFEVIIILWEGVRRERRLKI